MIRQYVLELYKDESGPYTSHSLTPNYFATLDFEDTLNLGGPFMGSEVRQALFDMDPFKAPGPNGFHVLFFQRHWELVGNQLIQFALNILIGKEFPEGFNDTFITLIQKLENP